MGSVAACTQTYSHTLKNLVFGAKQKSAFFACFSRAKPKVLGVLAGFAGQ
jgi:hypothetical protein